MKPLVFYIDPSLTELALRASPLVYPLWGRRPHDTVSFGAAFTQHPFDRREYQSTDDPDACDLHFWPFNYWATLKNGKHEMLDAAYAQARAHGKKLLVDAFGDTMHPVPYEHAIVLRFAQYRRHLKDNDIIIPAYVEDLLETYRGGHLSVRQKTETPMVGFVGWGSFPFLKHIRSYIKEIPVFVRALLFPSAGIYRKGVFLRSAALKALQRTEGIRTEFRIRSSYSGNIRTAEKDPAELRREFVDNIDQTDYTLCQKGDANQSTRVFEVLSLGRIPLVIDTECVFPLENQIPYGEFCVFVDHRYVAEAGKALAEFHASLSPEQFQAMQKKARETYEKFLRIDAFTPFLMEEIKRRL